MNKPVTILSTKIISSLLKKQLLENNIIVEEHDFIKTIAVENSNIKSVIKTNLTHYIFTSKKAVEVFSVHLKRFQIRLPAKYWVYCLEGATQKAVINAGMQPAITASTAWELAKMIHQKGIKKKLIFFCSDIRRSDLPEFLYSVNIEVKEIILYNTVLQPKPILKNYKAVLFFSPSAVQSFFMSNKLKHDVASFCIGNTTATVLKEAVNLKNVFISDKPTQQNVIEKLITYLS